MNAIDWERTQKACPEAGVMRLPEIGGERRRPCDPGRIGRRARDRRRHPAVALMISSLLLAPAAAGCSEVSSAFAPFPSSSSAQPAASGSPQQAAASPQAPPSVVSNQVDAAPAAVADASATAAPAVASDASPPPAPPPQQGMTARSLVDSYASFLEMFRDHEPDPNASPPTAAAAPSPVSPARDASVGTSPQQ